jgi:hypothetical protein
MNFLLLPSVFIPDSVPAFIPIAVMMSVWVIIAPSGWIRSVMMMVVILVIKRMRKIIRPEYRFACNYLHMRRRDKQPDMRLTVRIF